MSDVKEPLVQIERALTENHLDDADRKALDKLVVAHLLKSQAVLESLREQLRRCEAELDQAKETIAALRTENAKLVKDRDWLTMERDAYLKYLNAIARPQVTFTAEELAELEKNGRPLDDLIRELEGARG
jgi:hypothetical protein